MYELYIYARVYVCACVCMCYIYMRVCMYVLYICACVCMCNITLLFSYFLLFIGFTVVNTDHQEQHNIAVAALIHLYISALSKNDSSSDKEQVFKCFMPDNKISVNCRRTCVYDFASNADDEDRKTFFSMAEFLQLI